MLLLSQSDYYAACRIEQVIDVKVNTEKLGTVLVRKIGHRRQLAGAPILHDDMIPDEGDTILELDSALLLGPRLVLFLPHQEPATLFQHHFRSQAFWARL